VELHVKDGFALSLLFYWNRIARVHQNKFLAFASMVIASQDNRCWSALLAGEACDFSRGNSRCSGSSRGIGKKSITFKERFCLQCCRDGFFVPAHRVRALPIRQGEPFLQNNRTPGVWTVGHVLGLPPFRVVNHTFCCNGPHLVIFHPMYDRTPRGEMSSTGAPLSALPHHDINSIRWIALPMAWLSSDTKSVHMRIANGTLVPNHNRLHATRLPCALPFDIDGNTRIISTEGSRSTFVNLKVTLDNQICSTPMNIATHKDALVLNTVADAIPTAIARSSYTRTPDDILTRFSDIVLLSSKMTSHSTYALSSSHSDTEACTTDSDSETGDNTHNPIASLMADSHANHKHFNAAGHNFDFPDTKLHNTAVYVLGNWMRSKKKGESIPRVQ
jgi:hypothetical protein